MVCGKRRSGEECAANKRIIDGQDADDNCVEWPWMVSSKLGKNSDMKEEENGIIASNSRYPHFLLILQQFL